MNLYLYFSVLTQEQYFRGVKMIISNLDSLQENQARMGLPRQFTLKQLPDV